VIGQIGTLSGNCRVIIPNFARGRADSDHAVGVVNVDSQISQQWLHSIRACPSIRFARVVQL
jgi:hypothetical protein